MLNESHQCIARLKKIIRPLSETSINKLEELIIKILLMCTQFQDVNELNLKCLVTVFLVLKKKKCQVIKMDSFFSFFYACMSCVRT